MASVDQSQRIVVDDLIRKEIDHFHFLSLIREGGMGKVYRGEDTETGQKVAIKMLRRERFDNNPEALERFLRGSSNRQQLAR